MKEFIKSTLRGSGEGISSKRVTMFIFIGMFIWEFMEWYVMKLPPNQTLNNQLFTFLLAALGTIFGEPLMEAVRSNAQKKIDDSNKGS